MSTAADTARKPNAFNEANEALYNAYQDYELFYDFYGHVPWPEWNDSELNAEIWEEPKPKLNTAAKSALSLPVSNALFEDPDPPDISLLLNDVCFWKRPHELFPNTTLTVFNPSNAEFELWIPSPVASCGFLTTFIELLPILQYYALKYSFPVEWETQKFTANTQGEPWRPWHHVYALCKTGKGQIHKPLCNPYGKYIVRLFYMGCWRRFVVDDRIPCDKDGNIMLPCTQSAGELWSILVAKAILKILSQRIATEFSVMDFSFLSLFTGWLSWNITVMNKSQEQIWRRFYALTPSYEIPVELEIKTAVPSLKDNASKRGSSKRDSIKGLEKKNLQLVEMFCFVLATLKDYSQEEDFSATHNVALIMNRNLPLVKAQKREKTKMWKRIRWIYWASAKGLWTDELKLPPYRRMQCITFEKELSKLLAPDPKQEAAIYDIPKNDDFSSEQLSGVIDDLYEPEQWLDFFKIYDFLNDLNVLLKPSYFNSNFKVTSLNNYREGHTESTKATAKQGPAPPSNSFFLSPCLMPTCNEPLLLFCESLSGIFLSFSLSVCPQFSKNSFGYLDAIQPEILKVGNATLIVEQYDWRMPEQGPLIGFLTTVGSSALGLNLKPGRHILKLWLNSDCPYVIDIFSNVEVFVHKGPKIRFLMEKEAERILTYINNVSNAFLSLAQKFGKPDLASALREFYTTLKPGNDSLVGYHAKLDNFIETFLNCILLTLNPLINNAEEMKITKGSLRSLFLNPNIGCELPECGSNSYDLMGSKKAASKIAPVVSEKTLAEVLEYSWSFAEIDQIILIQRIFRGFRVRLLWKRQMNERKEFKLYTDRLKKVCDLLFVPLKRETEVGRLLRKVLMTDPDLLYTFKFYEDFSNVIQMDEFLGKINNVEPFAWVPIARFIIANHGEQLVPCGFYFSSNLQQFVIQCVNNDTNEELFRLTTSVSPHYYQSNVKGYTIFVFGWNEANIKTVNWRIEMVRMKHFQVIHLCNTLMNSTCHPYSIPSLEVSELKNFYVPNHKSRLCRCLIKIKKRTLLTLRLSVSYPEVQFVLMILLDRKFGSTDSEISKVSNKVIVEVQSTNGAVILPSIILEHFEPDFLWDRNKQEEEPTLYVVEAFILHNSWPLTKQEWGVVEPIRVNGENWRESTLSLQSKKGGSDSRKKLSRLSKKAVNELRPIENPFWLLQTLNDSSDGQDAGDALMVEEDRSYAESIKAMKLSWEEKNPGRRKKGRELRFNFLCMIYLEWSKSLADAEGVFGELERESDKEDENCGDIKSLLERMSSFSYLTNDKSPTRYLKSPRVLPKMPTKEMLMKYSKRVENTLNTTDHTSSLEEDSEGSAKLRRNIRDETEEERKDFLGQCLHYRLIMINHLTEEQKISNQLITQAYEGRLKAIERLHR